MRTQAGPPPAGGRSAADLCLKLPPESAADKSPIPGVQSPPESEKENPPRTKIRGEQKSAAEEVRRGQCLWPSGHFRVRVRLTVSVGVRVTVIVKVGVRVSVRVGVRVDG